MVELKDRQPQEMEGKLQASLTSNVDVMHVCIFKSLQLDGFYVEKSESFFSFIFISLRLITLQYFSGFAIH